jgi:hypothetical protein
VKRREFITLLGGTAVASGGSLRCSKSAGHEGEAEILPVMPLAVSDLAAEQLKRISDATFLWRKGGK